MLGVYFSGTGNTKYCVERLLKHYDPEAKALSIEDPQIEACLEEHRQVVFGYPVQFSSLPKLVRDFIDGHRALWRGKRIFIIATMGLFSGDGSGLSARLFRAYGAEITGGVHLKMPDSICDEKALKRTIEQNRTLVRQAGEKLAAAALGLREGNPPREGLGVWSHLAGLFGQRLYFGGKTKAYSGKLNIDGAVCTGCGTCAALCPMKNIRVEGGKAVPGNRCTMCYRCANRCPRQAVTLLGKRVVQQGFLEQYL